MAFLLAITAIAGVVHLSGCTEQQRAKNLGGSTTVTLPAGKKLVCVTWKEANLWYLTRDMRPDEKAETYEFKESSDYGVLQGAVTIKEQK
jgi:hypothetical protein